MGLELLLQKEPKPDLYGATIPGDDLTTLQVLYPFHPLLKHVRHLTLRHLSRLLLKADSGLRLQGIVGEGA